MPDQLSIDQQRTLIASLARDLEKTSGRVQMFETHISWILVARPYAYKIKKAVHFDFVDFSTLDARRFFCAEELRLNRRLAAELYLSTVPICGSPTQPVLDGSGTAIEFAVKMRAFEQSALWDYRIEQDLITRGEIDELAGMLARFHQTTAVATPDTPWGMPSLLQSIANENIAHVAAIEPGAHAKWLQWESAQQEALRGTFERRKHQGHIRECHGDLHSANIVTIDDRVAVFDCIEFNQSLRWIDVMNDIAFACMDLQFKGREDLAARLLNRYLEASGDYAGLAVLGYYQTHRALVRAKVAVLRAAQCAVDSAELRAAREQAKKYLDLAARGIQPARAALMITHGYAGSGKSTLAGKLVELLDAVQLRSDVERKRMHGLMPTSRAGGAPESGLYDPDSTQATYEYLLRLARHILMAGKSLIVDAAFLKEAQRRMFAGLALELGVPFFILDIGARETTLQARIIARARHGRDPSDANLAVLEYQMAHHDALTKEEMRHVIAIDSEAGFEAEALRNISASMMPRGVS